MEQPQNGNGAPTMAQSPTFRLVIEWSPQQGRIEVGWPQIDDVAKLGMLEMAKQVLTEARVKSATATQSPLIIPARLAH